MKKGSGERDVEAATVTEPKTKKKSVSLDPSSDTKKQVVLVVKKKEESKEATSSVKAASVREFFFEDFFNRICFCIYRAKN